MKARPIQIAAAATGGGNVFVFALMSDGRIWKCCNGNAFTLMPEPGE